MPKTETEPTQSAREQRWPRWNPELQRFDQPPTKAQMTVLRDLCARTKTSILDVYPTSRHDAGERIAGLIKLRRAQKRRRKRALKRAERLRARPNPGITSPVSWSRASSRCLTGRNPVGNTTP